MPQVCPLKVSRSSWPERGPVFFVAFRRLKVPHPRWTRSGTGERRESSSSTARPHLRPPREQQTPIAASATTRSSVLAPRSSTSNFSTFLVIRRSVPCRPACMPALMCFTGSSARMGRQSAVLIPANRPGSSEITASAVGCWSGTLSRIATEVTVNLAAEGYPLGVRIEIRPEDLQIRATFCGSSPSTAEKFKVSQGGPDAPPVRSEKAITASEELPTEAFKATSDRRKLGRKDEHPCAIIWT